MPRKCSVIGCRVNYRKRKNDDNTNSSVSIFRFPKETARIEEWLRKIPQENLTADKITDNMGVCEHHFDQRFILRDYTFSRPDGTTVRCPRSAPVLSDDAIPTLFPNTPSYLSTVPPPKRTTPDERRLAATARDEQQFQKWLDDDIVTNYEDFQSKLQSKTVDLGSDWIVVSKADFVLFVNIDSSCCPIVVCSFKVFRDMAVTIYDTKQQCDNNEFRWLLGDDCKLTRWSQLPNLCVHLSNACQAQPTVSSTDDNVNVVVDRIKQLIHTSKNEENSKLEFRLKFVLRQIELLYSMQKRYTPDCMLMAFKIYCSSKSTYCYLRETCLTLPHPSYLRQLTSCFSQCCQSLTDDDAHFVYLKQKCGALAEHERLVVLLLDEIYVKPRVTYKGGSLQGFAENSADTVEATTVQAYMISSVLSKHKDVAALQPIKNLDMSFLHDSVSKVLCLVERAGYKVLAVLSDNNRVNRNMFDKMCGGTMRPCIPHPYDSQRKLFFLFDSVHLIKCIRNNWINQTDQTLRYPNQTSALTGVLCNASFAHLKQLYDSERTAVVKLAPSLTFTALNPNNLQRQNVQLALKVFNEKLVAALDEFAKSTNSNYSGTQNFISTISQLWKICNVKHALRGQRLNDPYCEPIMGLDDSKLQWLKSFHEWLCAWEGQNISQRQGILSRETMFALKHTVISMVSLCEYLLTTPVGSQQMKYVLLGKFQTDNLEFRFGQYRQMSGANYNVSVTQVMESEKKLKILSVMKIISCGKTDITLRDFIAGCQAEIDNIEQTSTDSGCLTPFMSVLSECDCITISDAEMSAIVFIAGYVAFKMRSKITCIDCQLELLTQRALECDYPVNDTFDYMFKIDRGRLTWPTELMVDVVVQTIIVFKCLTSDKYNKQFIAASNQRSIVAKLALQRCQQVVYMAYQCSTCNSSMTDLAEMCIKPVCNISLNNFTKHLADHKTQAKTLRKLSTLTK